ncbi:MAG: DUF5320 domain-containing protein [Nitrospirota bacterium]
MPFGDRTGPLGLGPRTGRAMGYCAGFGMPGYANPVPGRGWFGRGRGWRHWYWATGIPGWAGYDYPLYAPEFTAKDEMNILQDQADFLKKQLEDIQNRISTLEKAQKQETS